MIKCKVESWRGNCISVQLKRENFATFAIVSNSFNSNQKFKNICKTFLSFKLISPRWRMRPLRPCFILMIFFDKLIFLRSYKDKSTEHNRHLCRKTTVLSCHGCLKALVLKKLATIKYKLNFKHMMSQVKVNITILTTVYILQSMLFHFVVKVKITLTWRLQTSFVAQMDASF